MVYNDSESTTGQFLNYYMNPHYASTRPHRDDHSRFAYIADFLTQAVPLESRVLEIGTAEGGLLELLKERGFDDCVGVNLPDDDPNGEFDLVIVNQVLEHVPNVREFLSAIRDVLSDDGLLYIDVPDIDGYVSQAQLSFNFFNFEHLNHFSLPHLDYLMRSEAVRSGRSRPEIVPGFRSPMIYGLWRFGPGMLPRGLPVTTESVSRYIDHATVQEWRYTRRVLNALGDRKEVVIRGCSHRAWHLLALPEFRHLEVIEMVDSATQTQLLTWNGRPVLSPEDPLPANIPIIPMADSSHIVETMARDYANREVIL